MARFGTLPNELVCEILKLVRPEDLENFAQVSCSVHSLASPLLTEHRALIRKYHTLRNDTDPASIATLLATVLANPCIGSYVRVIELSHLRGKNACTGEELEIFTIAALESECLKRPPEEQILDEREYWSNKIQNGSQDILLAILLPLMPNLAVLSVQADSQRLQWYHSAIEQAASSMRPTLRKLKRVRLISSGPDSYHLADIQKFSALPSVRVLTAPNAHGVNSLHEVSSDLISNVTHLKLWGNYADSKTLYEFLGGFPKLQSFTYSGEGDRQNSLDSFLIRSSLLAHCKATLQDLTLLYPRSRYPLFMGSLRGFESLKEVYTEWGFLISESSGRGAQLNERLPSSLVRLKIHDSAGRERYKYESVIKSAQYAKEHRLQKLKWLVFGGIRVKWSLEDIDRDLRKTCLNMGISLIFSPYAPKSGE